MGRKDGYGLGGRLRSLLHGRSSISSPNSPSAVISPKSPAPRLGLSVLLSPTIDLPGLPSHGSQSSPVPAQHQTTRGISSPTASTISSRPAWRRQSQPITQAPSPTLSQSGQRGQSSSQSRWDWEHVRDNSGRVRRRRRRRMGQKRPRDGIKGILRSKTGRLKLLRCLGLGSLLVIGSTVYLALALSNVLKGLNIHIFMIVIGLILVMAFAHATVRLCMYILQPPKYPISRTASNATIATEEPIPVLVRRDEEDFSEDEIDGVPKDATLPMPPPVYGLWRGSTRMNPNLMHWRRVETLQREAASSDRITSISEQTSSPNRPPSYATEDGVTYVMEAQPRSTTQDADSEALPIHPSERGRIALGAL